MNVCLSIAVGDEVECLNFNCDRFELHDGITGKIEFYGVPRFSEREADIVDTLDQLGALDLFTIDDCEDQNLGKSVNISTYCSDIYNMVIEEI